MFELFTEGNNDDSISKERILTKKCDNESYYVPPKTVKDTKQGKKLIKRPANSNGSVFILDTITVINI